MKYDSIGGSLFSVPFWYTKVSPWEEVKSKILSIVADQSYEIDQGVKTDFWTKNSYSKEVYEILKPYVESIVCKHITSKFPEEVPDVWTQKYYAGSEHSVHNHGNRGLSFILYLKFNPKVHKGTVFYAPFDDIFTGTTIAFVPDIREGDLIAFPSVIKHSSQYQTSDEERMILSFNLFPDGPV
jgi:hypothetical protein